MGRLLTLLRQKGAFSPTDIAGLTLWLDASDLTTITDAGSGEVSQWNDKSGNSYHVTQPSTPRPITGTRTLNGLNTLDFDGTSDFMARTATQLVNASTGEWSAFAVVVSDNVAADAHVLNSDDVTSVRLAQMLRMVSATQKATVFNTANGFFEDVASGTMVNSTPYVMGAVRSASAIESFLNGASNGATATTGTPRTNASVFQISKVIASGGNYWDGQIAEVRVYNRALTAAERQQTEADLAAKWAVMLS